MDSDPPAWWNSGHHQRITSAKFPYVFSMTTLRASTYVSTFYVPTSKWQPNKTFQMLEDFAYFVEDKCEQDEPRTAMELGLSAFEWETGTQGIFLRLSNTIVVARIGHLPSVFENCLVVYDNGLFNNPWSDEMELRSLAKRGSVSGEKSDETLAPPGGKARPKKSKNSAGLEVGSPTHSDFGKDSSPRHAQKASAGKGKKSPRNKPVAYLKAQNVKCILLFMHAPADTPVQGNELMTLLTGADGSDLNGASAKIVTGGNIAKLPDARAVLFWPTKKWKDLEPIQNSITPKGLIESVFADLDLTETNSDLWKVRKGRAGRCYKKVTAENLEVFKIHLKMKASVQQVLEVLHYSVIQYFPKWDPHFKQGFIEETWPEGSAMYWKFVGGGLKHDYFMFHSLIEVPNVGLVVFERSIPPLFPGTPPLDKDFYRGSVEYQMRIIRPGKDDEGTELIHVQASQVLLWWYVETQSLDQTLNHFWQPSFPSALANSRPRQRNPRGIDETVRGLQQLDQLAQELGPHLSPPMPSTLEAKLRSSGEEGVGAKSHSFREPKGFRTPETSSIPFDLDPVYQYPLPPLDVHLQELDGKLYFRNLCKQEFTEESLDCYFEIVRFKNSPENLRKNMAVKIWNEYFFHKDDPSEDLTTQPNRTVNVTSNLYTTLRDKVETKDISIDMFDSAEVALLKLLSENTYFKYTQTIHFEDWLAAKGISGKKLRQQWAKENTK